MNFRHHHYYAGSFMRNGVRCLVSDVGYASVTPPPKQPYKKKISRWKRIKTAIAIWWERLIIKLRRA